MCTCVRFGDGNGNLFMGRNLDWCSSYGQKITIVPRNYKYVSEFLGEMTPVSGAIIGMGIIEENKPLYFDCANEAGLMVAGLNFPGYAKYESTHIDGKLNVATYEFPLYIAMNFKTVDEAEQALKNVAIIAKPINDKFPVSELHYMIGDSKRSIVVEYTENGMEIYHNDADVLTNQPGYGWHKENLRNYMNLNEEMPTEVDWGKVKMKAFGSGPLMQGLPGDYYPTSRFIRATYLNAHYPIKDTEEDNISKLFHILNGVSMVEGAAKMADGQSEITIYTGGYSSATRTYYYRTYEDQDTKNVSMNNLELDQAGLLQI